MGPVYINGWSIGSRTFLWESGLPKGGASCDMEVPQVEDEEPEEEGSEVDIVAGLNGFDTGAGLGASDVDSPSVSESCCGVDLEVEGAGLDDSARSICMAPCDGGVSERGGPSMGASMAVVAGKGRVSGRQSSSGGHVARSDLCWLTDAMIS